MTSGTTRTHLVWDWNGTLLDDTHAVIQATNAAFAEVELAPITLDQYREMYTIPIPRFYERFLGRLPTEAEWERMDGIFHRYYAEQRVGCGLTAGVEELLHRWQRAGRSQSLLSMYGHEQLVPVVTAHLTTRTVHAPPSPAARCRGVICRVGPAAPPRLSPYRRG
ncbi:HAD family hydrolase, partial [Streptomyces sp. McG3]|uniref:HAD family hydrolase n=1 Tax=Streptomyces sp. McG3 TaxID=2725483 RepID=UPI00203705FC